MPMRKCSGTSSRKRERERKGGKREGGKRERERGRRERVREGEGMVVEAKIERDMVEYSSNVKQ